MVDLVNAAQATAWVGSTPPEALISQVSRGILAYLQRASIFPQSYTEFWDGDYVGRRSLTLRNWPVASVTSLVIDGVAIPQAPALTAGQTFHRGYTLEAGDIPPPGRMQSLYLWGHEFRRGHQNIIVGYQAGYQVSGEAQTVPSVSPYTVAVTQPFGLWATDVGVSYATGVAFTAVPGIPAQGQYSVANGIYTFAAADAGAAISISYGYVPADLALAALTWIKAEFERQQRLVDMSVDKAGDTQQTYAASIMPPSVKAYLAPYRRVVPI
jgi:hypothetical protein